jgi:hypothetical protein
MKFAKIVFYIAGIWGLFLITPLYFLFDYIGAKTPPVVTHPEYFYGFVGVTLAWQIAFLVIGTDPVRYRPLIVPSIIEKVTYVIAICALVSQHRIPTFDLAFVATDSTLTVLFIAAWFIVPRSWPPTSRAQ